MKNLGVILRASVLAAALLTNPAASAGEIQTGQSIVFDEADFASAKTAQKPWVVHRPSDPEETKVWEINGPMKRDPAIDDGRIFHAPEAKDGNVVWKIVVPEAYTIKDFTWAVDGLALTGVPEGDDEVILEFSTDGKAWQEIFRKENHRTHTGDPQWIRRQIYFEKLSRPGSSELYLRLRHGEGPNPDDPGYFAVWSKFTEGGEEPNSYFEVSVIRK